MTDYTGNSNYGKPKSEYLEKLKDMDDAELAEHCSQYIWLSAYASNNPRSDYHWMCDACYDECNRRDKVDIYTKAHKALVDACWETGIRPRASSGGGELGAARMRFLRKRAAKREGVPFDEREFWPPYYISFGHPGPNNTEVLKALYDAKCNDVVPVFRGGGKTHFYRVVRISRAPGGDHIVWYLQFDIEYIRTEALAE